MKIELTILRASLLAGALSFAGCYTQLATVEDEPSYGSSSQSSSEYSDDQLPPDTTLASDSTLVTDQVDHQPYLGYDYYYPPMYQGPVVIYDPYDWWWDRPVHYWGWYNPWYSCYSYPAWWYYQPVRPWISGGGSYVWTVRDDGSTRSSGTRRSGGSDRRDLSGARGDASNVGGLSAGRNGGSGYTSGGGSSQPAAGRGAEFESWSGSHVSDDYAFRSKHSAKHFERSLGSASDSTSFA